MLTYTTPTHTESSVNLPKYQSRTKTLDGFLSKLRNRKPHGGATTGNTIPSAVARMKINAISTDQDKILDKYVKLPFSPFAIVSVELVLIKRGILHLRGR